MRPTALVLAVALVVGVNVVARVNPDTPALFESGKIPTLAINSVEVGGGEVLLEVSIDKTGAVTTMTPLRETATFTERMTQSVKTWHFKPAEAEIAPARRTVGGPEKEAVDSRVLVAGVFRRPSVIGVTFGEPIKDVAQASPDIPFPSNLVTPPYPPGTMTPGVVLVEVKIDASGAVTEARTRIPSPGYDSAALSTARQWRFRPAKPNGLAATSVAYIVFGFPVPQG